MTLSGGPQRADRDRPKPPARRIRGALGVMAGHMLADAEGRQRVPRAAGLDRTVVRGPRLTEEPARGTDRVGWVGVGSTRISWGDRADGILTQVEDRRFVGHQPFVST